MNRLRNSCMMDEFYIRRAQRIPVELPPRIDQLVEERHPESDNISSLAAVLRAGLDAASSGTRSSSRQAAVTLDLSDNSKEARACLRHSMRKWFTLQTQMRTPPAEVPPSRYLSFLLDHGSMDRTDMASDSDSAEEGVTTTTHAFPSLVVLDGAARPLHPAMKRDAVAGLLGWQSRVSYAASAQMRTLQKPLPPASLARLCTVGLPLNEYVEGVLELRVWQARGRVGVIPLGVPVVHAAAAMENAEPYGTPTPYLGNPTNLAEHEDVSEDLTMARTDMAKGCADGKVLDGYSSCNSECCGPCDLSSSPTIGTPLSSFRNGHCNEVAV